MVCRVHLCHSGAVTTAGGPDYAALLAFRTAIRRFVRWSERKSEAAGLTPAQHQLLLAVKGHDHQLGPRIGDVAELRQLEPLLRDIVQARGVTGDAAATGA